MSTVMTSGPVPAPADTTLLEAVKRGDNEAFEALFDRHYARVYSVAMRVVGSAEDAEEIALDIFMRLYRRPVEITDENALGGWLYRAAMNSAFNSVRARNRRLGRLRKLAIFERSESRAEASPAALAERNEDIERVRQGLARLPEKQRNALVLRSHGMQYNEIAAALDIAPSSVGTTLARAERALRRQLEDEGANR